MAITDWTIVRRSLLGRRFLSATTALTVAVAVALMVVIIAVKDAGYRAFERGAGNMHLVVSRDASPLVSVLNAVFYANAPRAPLTWGEYEALASRFPLEFAVPVQQGDSYRGFPVIATTPEYFSAYRPDARGERQWTLAEGRFFESTWEVVLGADLASQTAARLGDEIFLTHGMGARDTAPPAPKSEAHDDHAHDDHDHDHDHHGHDHVHHEFGFRIVGILGPTGGPQDRAAFTTLEASWIVHAHDRRLAADPHASVTTASDLTDADRLITGIYLRVAGREGSMLAGGLQQVFDQLRRDTSITVAQPEAQIRNLFRIVSSIDQLFIGLVAVVMASSAIAIMLAMYSATEQRRRQIAVLRVLGFSRRRIFGLVLTESAVLGLVGGGAGVLLALLGAQIVAAAMRARLGLVIEPRIFTEWTLVIVTGTVLMAALAGIIPAVRAYRVSVARNLAAFG
jgi:putative ABC transport system permease protein